MHNFLFFSLTRIVGNERNELFTFKKLEFSLIAPCHGTSLLDCDFLTLSCTFPESAL